MELDSRIMAWISDILALEPDLTYFILPELLLISTDDFELADLGLEERDIKFDLSVAHYTFSKLLGNMINIKVLLQSDKSIPMKLYLHEVNQLIFLTKSLKHLTKK